MREIAFNAKPHEVRAILDGMQTQFRRFVKPQPIDSVDVDGNFYAGDHSAYVKVDGHPNWRTQFALECARWNPGDRLWVRETWGYTAQCDDINGPGDVVAYAAGGEHVYEDVGGNRRLRRIKDGRVMCPNHFCWPPKPWKPSIHMPRWASRITLEVVSVRVERLQEISEGDALAEGICRGDGKWDTAGLQAFHRDPSGFYAYPSQVRHNAPCHAYRSLWESINGPGSWAANPWVWVVEFKRIEP